MPRQLTTAWRRKNDFWQDLDGLIESVSKQERIVLGADLNGHVGEGNIGDEEIMGIYGAGTRDKEGSMVMDFAKSMDLVIVNTYFKKKHKHRVAYKSGGKSTQVDRKQVEFMMHRRRDLNEMCDCKVMVNEVRRKAAPYGGRQNGSHGEKEKRTESKAKDTIVETEGDKLSRSV